MAEVEERLSNLMSKRGKITNKIQKIEKKIEVLQKQLAQAKKRDKFLEKAQNFYYTRHFYDENVGRTKEVNQLNKELMKLQL